MHPSPPAHGWVSLHGFRVCLSFCFLNHNLELRRLDPLPELHPHHFPSAPCELAFHQSDTRRKAREGISDQEGTFQINHQPPRLPSTVTIPWMRSRGEKEPSLTHPQVNEETKHQISVSQSLKHMEPYSQLSLLQHRLSNSASH